MKNIKDYNLDELQEELINMGEKKFRAEQIFKWIYKEKVKSFDEMTNLSIELREKLKENYTKDGGGRTLLGGNFTFPLAYSKPG